MKTLIERRRSSRLIDTEFTEVSISKAMQRTT
jgi:hypothetical protein